MFLGQRRRSIVARISRSGSGAFLVSIATENTLRGSYFRVRKQGLNWSLVLKKREGYRRAFEKFDPEKVARYSGRQIHTLLADTDIIRNRMKVEGAVRNARALLKVQEEFGDFDSYCWRFVGGRPKINRWKTTREIPASSPESETFSKDLKRRGFSFVGPIVIYAYMQAIGMVNDHIVDCFRYAQISKANREQSVAPGNPVKERDRRGRGKTALFFGSNVQISVQRSKIADRNFP